MSSRVQDRSRRFNKSSNTNGVGSWKRTFAGDGNGSSQTDDELDENEQCIICAEKIEYAAKSPCNHTTCHKCTFRQRALYEKKACLVCRTENDNLVFTEELGKSYSDFNSSSFVKFDEKYGIGFSSQHAYDDTLGLLKYKCQLCDVIEKDSKGLGIHLKADHERMICNICAHNNKSFPSELKVYSQKQLQTHQTRGDENGFNGHPICPFCKSQRFYSDDELKIHLRQNHERCHVCDRIDASNPQYFKNYDSLEDHFKADHFICNVQVCLDKKFVVFEDELDLQAHMLQEHGAAYGKNYVVGASSNNRYRSQLSTFRPTNNGTNNNNGRNNSNGGAEADSLETKRMRFEERARHYLNYSTSAFKTFQDLNYSYKNGKLDALRLQDSYNELFKDNSEDEVHLLIYDLSELYSKTSAQGIELAAIVNKHERKTQEEKDFPVLPGSSNGFGSFGGSSWGNTTSSKKKSQKQRLEEEFPALPAARPTTSYTPVKTTIRYKTAAPQKSKATPVIVNQSKSTFVPNYLSSSAASSPSSSSTSLSSYAKPKPRPQVSLSNDLFPELPKLPPKRVIPRVNPIPQGNGAWDLGSASSSASSSALNLSSLDDSLPAVTKGKGKKKKQILFQMGGK